jgi:hypothetical protein
MVCHSHISEAVSFSVKPGAESCSGAKQAYSIVCGMPAPETALRLFGSLL